MPNGIARLFASTVRPLAMPRDFLQPDAEPLLLYPFRFREPVTCKWVKARYVAERRATHGRAPLA